MPQKVQLFKICCFRKVTPTATRTTCCKPKTCVGSSICDQEIQLCISISWASNSLHLIKFQIPHFNLKPFIEKLPYTS